MKRALLIVAFATVIVLVLAIIGQALTWSLDITYDQNGQVVNPSVATTIANGLNSVGILALPTTLATFVLGLVAMGANKQGGWIFALCVAAGLSFLGLIGMAWVLLSTTTPIAFVAPLIFVALTALAYALRPSTSPPVAVQP